jgi:hypothetical protein
MQGELATKRVFQQYRLKADINKMDHSLPSSIFIKGRNV